LTKEERCYNALVRQRREEVMGKLVSRAQDVASRVDKMQ
jgi:hypothetical protein